MASVDTVSPILPPELERAIFRIAAISWPRLILKFMLVAWRVNIWVEPFLYRTIILADSWGLDADKFDQYTFPFFMTPGDLIPLINSKPSAFFRDSVRNLRLGYDLTEEDALILSTCCAIENLWLKVQPSVRVLNFNFPLKRLHCTVEKMFGSSRIDFTHRLFSLLTHLEIFDHDWTAIDADDWSGLARLPHLTHLAFNEEGYLPICHTLLLTWESLQVLVVLLLERMTPNLLEEYDVLELAQERRFVVIECPAYLDDWSEGIIKGADYWSRAEDFIAARKSGQVNPLDYYIRDGSLDEEAE
ncbi:hypothetical protein K438DRAFT_1974440 [Mycena galopus ATCC 62051]|nr:hypothetical protein K438DRAFT_1974440 [Mycena galopus ATCC 62051]